jgi:hypothetical protein
MPRGRRTAARAASAALALVRSGDVIQSGAVPAERV